MLTTFQIGVFQQEWHFFVFNVCTRQEHLQLVDLRFEMMKNQVTESNQSIKTLREDIQSEVCGS